MELAFPWPASQGEWLAFSGAGLTMGVGLWHLLSLLFTHYPTALVARSQVAGMAIGAGAVALAMAQPLIYLALGAGWATVVLAQILAMARHGRAGGGTLLALLAALALAGLPLAYVFGIF